MGRKRRHEEHVNLERWLVSYADFITLLFAFFVVMYAMSTINESKYRVLSDTLVAAFDSPPKTLQPIQFGNEGVPSDPNALKSDRVAPGPVNVVKLDSSSSPTEGASLEKIADELEEALQPLIARDLIRINRTDFWVEVEINNNILFPSGSAELEDEAIPVLRKLASILKPYPNPIQVEGFTDNFPINTYAYPSNWELSAARAASVVHLFMRATVQPERMAAIGYGEYRPVADNATAEGRSKNRRVVVVILANSDARRLLEVKRNQANAVQPAAADPADALIRRNP